MPSHTPQQILHSVLYRREYQRERWGDEHDDGHTQAEWRALIDSYAKQGKWTDVAAIAIAALEAEERTRE